MFEKIIETKLVLAMIKLMSERKKHYLQEIFLMTVDEKMSSDHQCMPSCSHT